MQAYIISLLKASRNLNTIYAQKIKETQSISLPYLANKLIYKIYYYKKN